MLQVYILRREYDLQYNQCSGEKGEKAKKIFNKIMFFWKDTRIRRQRGNALSNIGSASKVMIRSGSTIMEDDGGEEDESS